jgi:hypothetical protein
MRRSDQRLVEAWRTVRIAELLEDFGEGDVAAWAGAETREGAWSSLLDYADDILIGRFSRVDDRVERVLGGGVENRFETRLEPIADWVLERGSFAQRDFFLFSARRDRDRARARTGNAFTFAKSERLEPPRTSPRAALRRARLACLAVTSAARPFLAFENQILGGAVSKRRWRVSTAGIEPTYAMREVHKGFVDKAY